MLVKDFSNSPAITVTPSETLKECLAIMEREGFRHLLVKEGDKLVGIVVRKDIEGALRQAARIPETPVDWVMSKNLVTVQEDASLIEALKLMQEYKYSGLPVMAGDQVVGMLTETDVVSALIKYLEMDK